MSRPWMPLYVGDYLADTRRLSTLEHGAYMLLIMEYWQQGGLPDDDAKLARIAGLSKDEWLDIRDAISELFMSGWRHKRIDAEMKRAQEKSERAAASAAKRWDKHQQCVGNANAYADAHANAMQPPPQSQSYIGGGGNARARLNEIEFELRKASGCENSVAPRLADLSPILGLIDAGYDLETEILPSIRAKPYPAAQTWGYFVPQVKRSRADRLAAKSVPEVVSQPRAGPPRKSENTMFAAVQRRQQARAKTHEPDRNVIELSPIADTSWSVAGKG